MVNPEVPSDYDRTSQCLRARYLGNYYLTAEQPVTVKMPNVIL